MKSPSLATLLAVVVLGAGGCGSTSAPRAPTGMDVAGDQPAPDSARRVTSAPWSFGNVEGRILRTVHYRIFTTEDDPRLIGRLPGFLERALDHYRSALGALPAPEERLDVYLMDSKPEWDRLTLHLLGEAGRRVTGLGRGGFATRGLAVFYDIGPFDTLAIAAHEGWHQYTQATFADPLPMWLEEGVAALMEGHRWAGDEPVFLAWSNLERHVQLRDAAAAGELLSLRTLLTTRPQDHIGGRNDRLLTYYAQVWALTHFLNEGEEGAHRQALRTLLRDAADGRLRQVLALRYGARPAMRMLTRRLGSQVFETYFLGPESGRSIADLDRSYRSFIDLVTAPGARDRIVNGDSPLMPKGGLPLR